MINCLKGCVRIYQKNGIRTPLSEHMFMPWVEVWMTGANKVIGVSNYSSKKNNAVVKSFQFGISNGAGVKIEIVDENGGEFSNFFERLSTGNQESVERCKLNFQFGWATAGCDGQGATKGPFTCCPVGESAKMSCVHTMYIQKISTNLQNGLFVFTVEGVDLQRDVATTRPRHNYGLDRDPQYLKLAIIKLCRDRLNLDVQLKRMVSNSCLEDEFVFNGGGEIDPELGPRGRWETKGRNVIQCCKEWLSDYVSDRRKAIISFHRTDRGRPILVFMESNLINCETNSNLDRGHLGTYIIGGKCSPVLQFTPEINFHPNVMQTLLRDTDSIPGGALSGRQTTLPGPEECVNISNAEFQGENIATIESDNSYRVFGRESSVISGRNRLINRHGNSMVFPISAELKLQGDPSYNNPVFVNAGFRISIIHLNPFVVAKRGDACEWLADPGCNNILSNPNWRTIGVSHDIREGSFTTTLKVMLESPGSNISRNLPLGAVRGEPIIP